MEGGAVEEKLAQKHGGGESESWFREKVRGRESSRFVMILSKSLRVRLLKISYWLLSLAEMWLRDRMST